MKISVVIPVFNAEKYLLDCIEALLGQDFPMEEYEIIMVDNGSTDKSTIIISAYPQIRLLKEVKRGAYAARNLGIRNARGAIIAFTDPDCSPTSDWLRNIYSEMATEKTDIVLGHNRPAIKSITLALLSTYEDAKARYIFDKGRKELFFGYTNNMAVKRHLFEDIGLFLELARGSDTIFVRTVSEYRTSDVIRYCPCIQVKHNEIRNSLHYYRKMFVYGKSRQLYKTIVQADRLSNRERLFLFRKVVRTKNFTTLRAILLFFLLGMGFFYWNFGSLVGAWAIKHHKVHFPTS